MIQEHWLTPDNLYKLSEISNDYFVFGSMEGRCGRTV